MTLDPIKPAFDPVTLAIPLFVLTIVGEILLRRFKKVKATSRAC
jgi:hypothetical protein